jgi:hypothetical protein
MVMGKQVLVNDKCAPAQQASWPPAWSTRQVRAAHPFAAAFAALAARGHRIIASDAAAAWEWLPVAIWV